jgi:hypothetical protein
VKLKEAAGKVRVIAIVDPFTNWVLKPLHKWIFSVLRQIPQDGTFDQGAPLKKIVGHPFGGSCDMSAATDRLPVKLQSALLSSIIGRTLADAWGDFLTARTYFSKDRKIWYKVGQPMGALSSWAMLALTHHFMWQLAAHRSGFLGGWYKSYAVLGDDSTCPDRVVVNQYLALCKELGVKVNLAKSLLSPVGCIEFAKRFFTLRGDCSPVSIGEVLVAQKNFATMSGLPRKRPIRIADLISIMGYKHKISGSLELKFSKLPKRVRNMLIVITSP